MPFITLVGQMVLIKFKFSGPRTPQRNGKVKKTFQTLYGDIRAILNYTGLENDIRSGLNAPVLSLFYLISHPLRHKMP
jgi:hypothetical protein